MGVLSINLMGGLGNQIFQLMFISQLAHKYGMTILIKDQYQLDSKRHTYFKLFPGIKLTNETIYGKSIKEIKFSFHDYMINPKENYIFTGYFQSYKYLKDINVHEVIKLPHDELNIVTNKMSRMRQSNSIMVSLHVRRGDYLVLKDCHPVQSIDYYKKCLQYIENNYGKVKIIVFSDDQSWCKNNLIFIPDVEFVNDKDYLELFMMSMCDHHIISNSSFSWWGAYLCKNLKKTVLYPRKWFGQRLAKHNTDDLCPVDWIGI